MRPRGHARLSKAALKWGLDAHTDLMHRSAQTPAGAVELQRELTKATQLELLPTVVFDYTTPDEMAQHLVSLLPAVISTPRVPATKATAVKTPRSEPALAPPPPPPPQQQQQQQQQQQVGRGQSWKQQQEPERRNFVMSKVSPHPTGFFLVHAKQSLGGLQIALIMPTSRLVQFTVCNQKTAMQVLEGIFSIVGASVGLQASLMSAGMDSLGAVELHRELCRWV